MQTFINPRIVLSKPVKRKAFGYTIVLEQKTPDHLIIKARSANGRGRGNVGIVARDGSISFDSNHRIVCLLTPKVRAKIAFTLDHLYGENRMKTCKFNDKGQILSNLKLSEI